MNDKSNTSSSNKLVKATWALAITSILALITTGYFMRMEVNEMKRATNIQIRPFAHIESDSLVYGIGYRIGDVSNRDVRDLKVVEIGSDAYKARSKVTITVKRRIIIKNFGKTPLWLQARYSSTLLEKEWRSLHNKDPFKLLEQIKRTPEFKPLETDLVILPGQEYKTKTLKGYHRLMDVFEFEEIRDSDSNFVLYPYTLVEYKDYLGNHFNTLRIYLIILDLDTSADTTNYNIIKLGEELYRWDIGL